MVILFHLFQHMRLQATSYINFFQSIAEPQDLKICQNHMPRDYWRKSYGIFHFWKNIVFSTDFTMYYGFFGQKEIRENYVGSSSMRKILYSIVSRLQFILWLVWLGKNRRKIVDLIHLINLLNKIYFLVISTFDYKQHKELRFDRKDLLIYMPRVDRKLLLICLEDEKTKKRSKNNKILSNSYYCMTFFYIYI